MRTAVTFAQLVQSKYIDAGMYKLQALAKIYTESGVSITTLRAALDGTRIQPDSARDLAAWCERVHRVKLDAAQLVMAPAKPPRRKTCDVLSHISAWVDEQMVEARAHGDASAWQAYAAVAEKLAEVRS